MYFASDASHTTAVCTALFEKISMQPELQWLALVDGAFDHGQAGLSLPNERHVLYDCDGMSDLLVASPFLFVLTTHDVSQLRLELSTLVRHRRERPMLSFIGTSSSVSAVNENFRLFANAVTDDDQAFLLRFADTRVLSGLPHALRQTYWDGMTCLLADWILIDREGKAQALPLRSNRMALKGEFRLSPSEFASLVTSSEPDAVIDAIAETNPEALPEGPRAAIYDKMTTSCAFAEKHKVRAFPDLVALAYLALLDDGKGLRDPKLSDMLLRSQWTAGSLINDLANFVD
ncbi:DUF4123 domain-containing protein [Massilia norwichensis]|uniref:DUF4123 domain-containing protein n=1 Tax=Massilia norwichensis TaxID=1442366 RepID=A0ABT2ABM6_9BURK|nr:DUF4123 domain-containing protein [Massilia norwichensis]MCS0591608.1 DUF4123 domain-containing protein [Massilia norwichensis]